MKNKFHEFLGVLLDFSPSLARWHIYYPVGYKHAIARAVAEKTGASLRPHRWPNGDDKLETGIPIDIGGDGSGS